MLTLNSNALEDIRAIQKKLGAVLKVPKSIEADLPRLDNVKLANLAKGGRDFSKFNATMRQRVRDSFQRALGPLIKGNSIDFDKPWVDVGIAVLRTIKDRIEDGHGGDVKMNELAASTVEAKRAAKMKRPTAIGYATGNLYNDLKAAIASRAIKVRR